MRCIKPHNFFDTDLIMLISLHAAVPLTSRHIPSNNCIPSRGNLLSFSLRESRKHWAIGAVYLLQIIISYSRRSWNARASSQSIALETCATAAAAFGPDFARARRGNVHNFFSGGHLVFLLFSHEHPTALRIAFYKFHKSDLSTVNYLFIVLVTYRIAQLSWIAVKNQYR